MNKYVLVASAVVMSIASSVFMMPRANAAISYGVCSTKASRTAVGEYPFVNVNNPKDQLVESSLVVYRSNTNPNLYCASGFAYGKNKLTSAGVGYCDASMVCAAGYSDAISAKRYTIEINVANAPFTYSKPYFEIKNKYGTYVASGTHLSR